VVAVGEHLGTQSEGGGDATGEVGADRPPRSVGREDGTMGDEIRRRPRLGIAAFVGLGQPPQFVVAENAFRAGAVADADLEIEHAPGLVPHLQQPVGAVARLGEQRGGAGHPT
jgi:hypothetical protein